MSALARARAAWRALPAADAPKSLKSLAAATERLRASNDRLEAWLAGNDDNPIARVANAPELGLVNAAARAQRFWDELERKRGDK